MFEFNWVLKEDKTVYKYTENDKKTAVKMYADFKKCLDEGTVVDFKMYDSETKTMYTPKKGKKVLPTVPAQGKVWCVNVRFKDNGKIFSYESDEQVPLFDEGGAPTEVLVAPNGVYATAFAVSCALVEKSEMKRLAKSERPSKILAIVKRLKKREVAA